MDLTDRPACAGSAGHVEGGGAGGGGGKGGGVIRKKSPSQGGPAGGNIFTTKTKLNPDSVHVWSRAAGRKATTGAVQIQTDNLVVILRGFPSCPVRTFNPHI